MGPVIGISVSTLLLPGTRGVRRFCLPEYYVDCVLDAGGIPYLLPNIPSKYADKLLESLDGLVLSGGVDVDPATYGEEPHPELGEVDAGRDAFEVALTHGARRMGLPIFAICRGVQVINVAAGGTLIQDISSDVKDHHQHAQKTVPPSALSHSIHVKSGTHLGTIVGEAKVRVNSFHHQAVDKVGDGYIACATAADGVIEAIEDPDHPFCIGVQWHPERMRNNELTKALFRAFVEVARRRAMTATR